MGLRSAESSRARVCLTVEAPARSSDVRKASIARDESKRAWGRGMSEISEDTDQIVRITASGLRRLEKRDY